MTETIHTLLVNVEATGLRLDKFLTQQLPELSRSRIQSLLEQLHVSMNGQTITDAAKKVKGGQAYLLTIPETAPSHIVAQDIPLDIVFEDEHLLIINKPAGLTVHPAPGHPDMTLVNALLAHCGESLSGIGGVARPGIVHRLDKETSGLMAVAKNDQAHAALSAQLSSRTLKRVYAAVVWGVPKPAKGTVKTNIGRSLRNRKKMGVLKTGGREAITHYTTLEQFSAPQAALVECRLETGRTHQIRVHMGYIGHSLIGDPVYGASTKSKLQAMMKTLPEKTRETLLAFDRQALHARAIGFIHPVSGKEMFFECPLPQDMQTLINVLK